MLITLISIHGVGRGSGEKDMDNGQRKKVNKTPCVLLSVTCLDSSTVPSRMYAALLTRISIRPYAAFASATAFRMFSSVSQTSRTKVAAPRAFRSSIFFRSRAVATTLSPFFMAALASRPPKPEEHPVMSQTFGDISFFIFTWIAQVRIEMIQRARDGAHQ